MGITALPLYVAASSLTSKQAQVILREFCLASQEIHAVYSSPKLLPTKINVPIEYLREAFAPVEWPALMAGMSQDAR